MSHRRVAAPSLALLMILGACDTGELGIDSADEGTMQTTPAVTEPQPEATTDEPESASGTPRPETEAEPTEATEQLTAEVDADSSSAPGETFELDPPVVFDDAGATLTVSHVRIVSRDEAEEAVPEISELIDDDVQAIALLKVRAANHTGQTISWYPDQGVLQIGSEQRDADLSFSDPVGGDMLEGTEAEGDVYWTFTTPAEELLAIGQARYVVGPPFTEDFESAAGEADLTITWAP